jgi:phage terminase Nu1 subunit (DNA packaging protein)
MSRVPVRPYLVTKDEEGVFRITVRTTRFNSQGYPLVSSELLENAFRTQTAARAYCRETYRAEAGDIATK